MKLHLLLFAPLLACADPVRILPIGDSITQGGKEGREEFTYRLPLQEMLEKEGVEFDFIGSRQAGLNPGFEWPEGFDPDHEGYYGAKTAMVLEKLRGVLGELAAPDIVLIHLGTNDQKAGDYAKTVGQPLGEMVELLRGKNPEVVVLLGHLNFTGGEAKEIRGVVEELASRLDRPDSPVKTVHHYEGFVANPQAAGTDTFDWAHPNPAGQKKMAAKWLAAMRPFLAKE